MGLVVRLHICLSIVPGIVQLFSLSSIVCSSPGVFQENFRMGGKFEWPGLDEVVEYRSTVRNMILELIENTPLSLPITMDSQWVSDRHPESLLVNPSLIV